jgi:hypothetical protein
VSIRDIRFEDLRRVASVLSDMHDGGQVKLSDIWSEIRAQVSKPPDPMPADFEGFDREFFGLGGVEDAVRGAVDLIRDELKQRHGEEYVADLWGRIQR